MKRMLLTHLALLFAPLLALAQPTTLKEVLAVEAEWQVLAERPKNSDPFSGATRRAMFRAESASAFLARITDARSDGERRNAAGIAKLNQAKLDSLVLTPAAGIDAAKAKALRDVLDRIAKAQSASLGDVSELKRLVDSVR